MKPGEGALGDFSPAPPPPKPPVLSRRVVQMIAAASGVLVLCADGTMWELRYNTSSPGTYYWHRLPPIPEG